MSARRALTVCLCLLAAATASAVTIDKANPERSLIESLRASRGDQSGPAPGSGPAGPASTPAPTIRVETSDYLEPEGETVRFGQGFNYVIEARWPDAPSAVEVARPERPEMDGLILGKVRPVSETRPGMTTVRWVYLLRPEREGQVVIQPTRIRWKETATGATLSAATEGVRLEALAPIPVWMRPKIIALFLLGLVLWVLVALLAMRVVRQIAEAERLAASAPRPVDALRDGDDELDRMVADGEGATLFERIAERVRYLMELTIPGMGGLTTGQIEARLEAEAAALPQDDLAWRRRALALLTKCDRVRFGAATTTRQDCEEALGQWRDLLVEGERRLSDRSERAQSGEGETKD